MESHTVLVDEDEFLPSPSPPALDTQKNTESPDNENASSESEDEDIFIGYIITAKITIIHRRNRDTGQKATMTIILTKSCQRDLQKVRVRQEGQVNNVGVIFLQNFFVL